MPLGVFKGIDAVFPGGIIGGDLPLLRGSGREPLHMVDKIRIRVYRNARG